MVILCDYKLRKFQRRLAAPDEAEAARAAPEKAAPDRAAPERAAPDEAVVKKMLEIEEALYRSKTKLMDSGPQFRRASF